MASYLIPSLFVIVAALFSWLLGPVLHLQGTALVLLRIVILVLGFLAAIGAYWFWSRRVTPGATSRGEHNSSDVISLLRSAEQRLAESQRGGVHSFDSVPVFYVLGVPNSAKTTTILKSGLDPELLAGQVYQDDVVVPTLLANVWYAKEAIFVDAGEGLSFGSSQWSTLVRQTSPGLLRSLVGTKRPLRAAVVCVSSESFFGPDATSKVSSLGREGNATLREMARQLGSDFPVYVLLTKLDRVPGFAEYVKNLNTEEVSERLGISLTRDGFSDGVYAERASSFLSSALDRLFYSLGEFRLEVLGREAESANAAAIYQFPRELQKLRTNLTNFLVELARPSHLNANPFLRGFFCVGVRAQIIEQLVSVGAEMPRRARVEAAATGILSLREIEGASQGFSGSQHVSRKIAQWCFLPQIFPDILLAKEEREQSPSSNVRVSLLRRIGLALVSILLFFWIVGLTVSYVKNRRLERLIDEAATSLPANAYPSDFASSTQLRELEQLRVVLDQLERFEQNGPPWSFRYGLYQGRKLIEPARKLYFQRFRWLLLASTQQRIRTALDQLPATAPPDADYLAAYNPLRAYLITTSFPQYSGEDFLAPILMQYWQNGRQSQSEEQVQLAERQFRFYSEELHRAKIYDIAPVTATVVHTRGYLNSFGSFDRIYQNMLAAAAGKVPSLDFNKLYPGSSATVLETHIVPGAFTKEGFAFIQTALKNPDRYFAGEDWVLGPQAAIAVQGQALAQKLAERYAIDFSMQWQSYLRAASVVRYRGLSDARQKLESLSSPNSALLALIFMASRNTAAAGGTIAQEFQPTQALVPPSLNGRLVAPGNTAYINGLIGLQGAVSQFIQDPSIANNPSALQSVITAAVNAHSAVSQTAHSFDIDSVAHVEQLVTKLMRQPITSVEEAVRGSAPQQINLAGRSFCSSISPLLSKYPFSRAASVEATPAEVTAALKPDTGLLWQFYEANLKPLVVQQGSQWILSPTATVKPTPQFLSFFNRLAVLSRALFANGATAPSLNFAAHILPSPGIQRVTLSIGGQQLSGHDVSGQFNWSAQGVQQAQLIASYGSNNLPLQFSGTWSLFHLMDRGRVEQSSNPLRVAYPLEISGTPIIVNGAALTERIELSGPAASILTPGGLSGLSCAVPVAR